MNTSSSGVKEGLPFMEENDERRECRQLGVRRSSCLVAIHRGVYDLVDETHVGTVSVKAKLL